MKISRTFITLIFTGLILFAATFYSSSIAQQIRNDEEIKRQLEITDKPQFWASHSYEEDDRNFADYTAAGLFILAMSTSVAAILIRKFDD